MASHQQMAGSSPFLPVRLPTSLLSPSHFYAVGSNPSFSAHLGLRQLIMEESNGAPPSSPRPAAKEMAFDITDAAFSSPEFRMFEFKIKRCPRARPHDWTLCPFAHPGEKAKRRDPRKTQYSGTACPDFRKGGSCPRGDACPFAHGVFECWLHPSRYRTQMCTDGIHCKRRVCFFAHFDSELRKAEADPILLSFQQLQPQQDVRAYHHQQQQQQQQQQIAQALGGMFVPASPQSYELMNSMGMGPPVMLPGGHDGSAPCTPTAAALTPACSQDQASLLAQLALLQQQQAAAAVADMQRPSSAPASGGNSPAGTTHGQGGMVSNSASGGTLGSSGSPPISPTGVCAAGEGGSAGRQGVSTPSIPDLAAQSLKGPLSPLGAALALQQAQQAQQQAQAQQDAAALALLLQQQGHHIDQTSLLVALHSLSLGGAPPPPPAGGLAGSGGGGLIRHASDVYMQTRAAAAAAAAVLSPPGHGLVSHRRSMDNSMLAQLQSLQSRNSPPLGVMAEGSYLSEGDPEGYISGADLAAEAARLSPIAISPGSLRGADMSGLDSVQFNAAMAAAAAVSPAPVAQQLGSPFAPCSPTSYQMLSPLAASAAEQLAAAGGPGGGGLQRILTSGGEGGPALNLPPTPQTAPAAVARDSWPRQLVSIDEGAPMPHMTAVDDLELRSKPQQALAGQGQGGIYKTLSDPSALTSVLGRNLSFDNILAELPRSSSQVNLATQQAASGAGDVSSGSKQG